MHLFIVVVFSQIMKWVEIEAVVIAWLAGHSVVKLFKLVKSNLGAIN